MTTKQRMLMYTAIIIVGMCYLWAGPTLTRKFGVRKLGQVEDKYIGKKGKLYIDISWCVDGYIEPEKGVYAKNMYGLVTEGGIYEFTHGQATELF